MLEEYLRIPIGRAKMTVPPGPISVTIGSLPGGTFISREMITRGSKDTRGIELFSTIHPPSIPSVNGPL
jgi:hypothetical protein